MYATRLSSLAVHAVAAALILLCAGTLAQAVTITVTGTADLLDPNDGVCTLREAIRTTHGDAGDCVEPSANSKPHEIMIPAGTYTLTIPGTSEFDGLTGDLNIPWHAEVTITGAGRDLTIIDANGLDRVLTIYPYADVEMSGITVTGGYSPDDYPWGGGGLWVTGSDLVVRNCTIEGNTGHYAYGGGVYADGAGNLTLDSCLIRNNEGYEGGGIHSESWNLRIVDSTIEGNTASGPGGGISNEADSFLLIRSAVINNNALTGGGIYSYDDMTVVNSTISGNSARFGGGIETTSDEDVILNSTITANNAIVHSGGVEAYGDMLVYNSIIAGNSPTDCEDTVGPPSGGYNVFGRNRGCYDYTTADFIEVEPDMVMTTVLGPLQDNGGPTPTHELLPGSPAIDAADPAGCLDENGDPLDIDQRGEPRPEDGDGDGVAICDTGAYEATTSNFPPTAIASSDAPVECSSSSGGLVTLDGSLSGDPNSTPGTNDDITLFEWFEDFALPGEVFLGVGETLPVVLAFGEHSITLRVTDNAGLTDTDTIDVEVIDTVPPEISVILDPDTLWPPNHRMVEVVAMVDASDVCGQPAIILQEILSDEPDDAAGGGDGTTVNDIQEADFGTADFAFMLRAERAAASGGRTYTITYLATDTAGNGTSASSTVFVPHHFNPRKSVESVGLRAGSPANVSSVVSPQAEDGTKPRADRRESVRPDRSRPSERRRRR